MALIPPFKFYKFLNMRKIILTILSSLSFIFVPAQRNYTENLNGWYMYFGGHKLSDKIGLHLEAQFRRNEIILNPQQLLLRTGINFHFNPSAFATAGYGFINTFPYGEQAVKCIFPEHRIWQQLQLKNLFGKFEIIHRYRMEERYVNAPVFEDSTYKPGPAVYTNRFRLFTRVSIPFKGNEISDHSFYLTAYDEFFINFGNNVKLNVFDQNRAYIALGYKIPKAGRLEIGYLNQFIFKADGISVENNHTLQLSLTSAIDFRRKKE